MGEVETQRESAESRVARIALPSVVPPINSEQLNIVKSFVYS